MDETVNDDNVQNQFKSIDSKAGLQTVIENFLSKNEAFFDLHGISLSEKGEFTLLNYQQDAEPNEYNCWCRALVLDQTGKVRSLPFARFFNKGQKEAADLDFANCDIIEKMDGCFDKETLIYFCDGTRHRIKDVVEQRMIGPIWGYDHQTQKVVPTMITAWHNNGPTADWRRVKVSDRHNGNGYGSIYCTPEHDYFSVEDKKYVQAKQMVGRIVLKLVASFSDLQKDIIYGTMLGDANLRAGGNSNTSWALRWSHCKKQDCWSKALAGAFPDKHVTHYSPKNNGNRYSTEDPLIYQICAAKELAEIADVCLVNGKKNVNDLWLEQLTPLSYAVWYMDDGSISFGQKYKQRPRALLHTEGFSEEEVDRIISFINVKFRFSAKKQTYRGFHSIRLNADDAEVFWNMIGPHMLPEMCYKMPEKFWPADNFWDKVKIERHHSVRCEQEKVVSVDEHHERVPKYASWSTKYDLTTTAENYFAGGVLVHNCLIGAFYDDGKLVFHTRRTISSHQPDMDLEIINFNGKPYSLLQIARKYVENLYWKEVYDRFSWCYAFELIHDATKVVTEYPEDKWGLYLLNYRNLVNFSDKHQINELVGVGNLLDARLPRVWKVKDASGIDAIIAEHPKDFEGVVARCRNTGERLKVKSPSYVERHHMVDRRTYRYLIPLWLKGERAEIEAYFPSVIPLFNDLEAALAEFTKKIKSLVTHWRERYNVGNWNKKQLAEQVFKHEDKKMHTYIFKFYDKDCHGQPDFMREWLKSKLPDVRCVEEMLGIKNRQNTEEA